MKITLIILIVGFLNSCNTEKEDMLKSDHFEDIMELKETVTDTVYIDRQEENSSLFIIDRLPDWFLELNILDGLKLKSKYKFDNRLNPLYLEADFNGDGNLDIAIPIKEIKSEKVGFAIIHGGSKDIHIIAAGTKLKNGLSDDMSYIDIWKINRSKVNEAGLEENTGTGKKGELIIINPSLQIEKTELGGGQIYWNGHEYAYFHQTC